MPFETPGSPVSNSSPGWGKYAAIAQSVERILGKDEVGSSNLPSSSKNTRNRKVSSVFSLLYRKLQKNGSGKKEAPVKRAQKTKGLIDREK